jgi:hypothetical protein
MTERGLATSNHVARQASRATLPPSASSVMCSVPGVTRPQDKAPRTRGRRECASECATCLAPCLARPGRQLPDKTLLNTAGHVPGNLPNLPNLPNF